MMKPVATCSAHTSSYEKPCCLNVFAILILSMLQVGLTSFAYADGALQMHATGQFTNGSTRGMVELVESDMGWAVRFGADFHHEGSPDPWVALGRDGFDRSGIIGKLKQFSGAQSFPVNDRLDPRAFNRVYIWCVRHNTSLGFAKLVWEVE